MPKSHLACDQCRKPCHALRQATLNYKYQKSQLYCLDASSFVVNLKLGSVSPPLASPLFFPPKLLLFSCLFNVHLNFRISSSNPKKKPSGILEEIYLNLEIQGVYYVLHLKYYAPQTMNISHLSMWLRLLYSICTTQQGL